MLRFDCVRDIAQAEKLWRLFSPQETIYDDWQFRALFHKYHQHELQFYVGYQNDEPVGFLPLQYNALEKHLEFWGGSYMEDNRVFIKPGFEQYIPEFYKNIPSKATLGYIRGTDPFTTQLPLEDYKYILPLQGISTIEDFIKKYPGKETGADLKKKFKKMTQAPVSIVRNNFEDIELLFEFNIAKFGEHSSFRDRPFHKEIFRELLHLPHDIHLYTFLLDGVKQAVSLCILYKTTYENFILGINPVAPAQLNAFINLKNLEFALAAGAQTFDLFTGNYGWKERWGCEKIPQYKFEN